MDLSHAQHNAMRKLARHNIIHNIQGLHVFLMPFAEKYVSQRTIDALERRGLIEPQPGDPGRINRENITKHLGKFPSVQRGEFEIYVLTPSGREYISECL